MKGSTLFSGIGGADCGMKWAGIESVAAVEFDPSNQAYSSMMQQSHVASFPDSQFFLSRVEDINWDLFPDVDILHASPVCSNFSLLSGLNGSKENANDIKMAIAVSRAISRKLPTYFSLEQVPQYLKSDSYKIIKLALEKNGYKINAKVLNLSDYGVPSDRIRLVVLCSRSDQWHFPEASRVMGWKEAIAGLPLERDRLSVLQSSLTLPNRSRDVLIQRIGASSRLIVREAYQPCWTITRSVFEDGKGGTRSKIATARINEIYYNLSTRAIARLMGFPDWFQLPQKYAGQGLGYSFPPFFYKQCLNSLIKSLDKQAIA